MQCCYFVTMHRDTNYNILLIYIYNIKTYIYICLKKKKNGK